MIGFVGSTRPLRFLVVILYLTIGLISDPISLNPGSLLFFSCLLPCVEFDSMEMNIAEVTVPIPTAETASVLIGLICL